MVGLLDILQGIFGADQQQQNRLAAIAQPAGTEQPTNMLAAAARPQYNSQNAYGFWNGQTNDATASNGDRLVRLPDGRVQRTSAKYGWSEVGSPGEGAGFAAGLGGNANGLTSPQDDAVSKSLSGNQNAATGHAKPPANSSGQGFGGFLQNLFNPQQQGLNDTVAWLQRKGYDEGAANYIAHNKDILRNILNEQIMGGKPNEYQMRAQVAQNLGFRPGTPEYQNFIAGRDVVKAADVPDSVQALQWRAQQVGLRPGSPEYQDFMRVNGGGVTTNVNMPADNEYDKTVGKGFGERFLEMQKDAQTAGKALNSLTVMDQAMNQPGFYSGTGAGAVQYGKRVAAALGLDPNGVSDMETFNAMTKSAALDAMGGSLSTGFSNADRDFVLDQVPNLSNSPEGNRQLIDIQRKLAQRKQQVAKLARDYADTKGGRIDAGFDDYLSKWAEQNPLFPKLPPKPKPASVTGPERVRNPETDRRPRARNPQTGQIIEWNGSQWEPVQ